ncbi:MAG: hypothetical protein ACPGTU_05520 [Myxococcota bacterium]
MSRSQTASAILFVSLSLFVSHVRASTERTGIERQAKDWATQHAQWNKDGTGSPETYWNARSPRGEPLQTLANVEPWRFWSTGAGQEAWAINAAAAVGPQSVPNEVIPLVAISTCSFLGMELPDEEEFFTELLALSTGAVRPWRYELLRRCGDCAPPTTPMPPTQDLHSVTHIKLNPLGARNIAIAAERERRAVLASPVQQSVLAHMVSRIRNGGDPSDEEWALRGVAGMAALELAKMNRQDAIPTLLNQAEHGPSRTDRIASLWAARQLGAKSVLIERVEAAL